jgi:hypothetical protein
LQLPKGKEGVYERQDEEEDEKESTVFQANHIQSLATVGIQHSYGQISPQV